MVNPDLAESLCSWINQRVAQSFFHELEQDLNAPDSPARLLETAKAAIHEAAALPIPGNFRLILGRSEVTLEVVDGEAQLLFRDPKTDLPLLAALALHT